MKLTELFLNRFLYRQSQQDLETKDAVYDASNVIPAPVPALAAGSAAQDINTSNVNISGESIEPGTIPPATLDVSNWGWGQTCVFSSTDLDTVSWGAGTFTSANGLSYSIGAGDTGNMLAKTYIYLDLNVSNTVYQTTTAPANAVGVGKVLIAIAQNASVSATFNLTEASQITGDNILANTIDASKINVGQLSAITADLGDINAGSININNVFEVDSDGNTKVNSLERNDFHWFTLFEGIDGYLQNPATTGTIIANPNSVDLKTAATLNDFTELLKYQIDSATQSQFTWSKRRKFKCLIQAVDNTNCIHYIMTGENGNASDNTKRHIGFQLVNNAIYATTGDGSNLTSSGSLANFNAGDYILLEIRYNPGVDAKFYINGTLVATITTTLPSGTSRAGYLMDVTVFTSANVAKELDVCYFDFWQEN